MAAKSWLSVASLHPWVTLQILLEWHKEGRSSPVHSWWRFPLWLDHLSLQFSSASQNRPGPQSETWLSASRTRPSRSFHWKLYYQSQFLAEWQCHAQIQVSFTALWYPLKVFMKDTQNVRTLSEAQTRTWHRWMVKMACDRELWTFIWVLAVVRDRAPSFRHCIIWTGRERPLNVKLTAWNNKH